MLLPLPDCKYQESKLKASCWWGGGSWKQIRSSDFQSRFIGWVCIELCWWTSRLDAAGSSSKAFEHCADCSAGCFWPPGIFASYNPEAAFRGEGKMERKGKRCLYIKQSWDRRKQVPSVFCHCYRSSKLIFLSNSLYCYTCFFLVGRSMQCRNIP